MQIAKTKYKENWGTSNTADPTPTATGEAPKSVDFMDTDPQPAAGLMTHILDRVAEYVEPAASSLPNQDELKEVASDMTEGLKNAFSRVTDRLTLPPATTQRNFMDLLTSSDPPAADTSQPPAVPDRSSMLRIKDSILEALSPSDTKRDIPASPPRSPEAKPLLESESSLLPVSVSDNIQVVMSTIRRMETAIANFSNSETDARPLSPTEDGKPKTRVEKLLSDMNRARPIWKGMDVAKTTVPQSGAVDKSAALIDQIETRMKKIRAKSDAVDVLDSHRSGQMTKSNQDTSDVHHHPASALKEIAKRIEVDVAESRATSRVTSPASSAAHDPLSQSMAGREAAFSETESDPEIIELPSPAATSVVPDSPEAAPAVVIPSSHISRRESFGQIGPASSHSSSRIESPRHTAPASSHLSRRESFGQVGPASSHGSSRTPPAVPSRSESVEQFDQPASCGTGTQSTPSVRSTHIRTPLIEATMVDDTPQRTPPVNPVRVEESRRTTPPIATSRSGWSSSSRSTSQPLSPSSVSPTVGTAISPSRWSTRRNRRQYCERCSRLISQRELGDLFAEEESKIWKRCGPCIAAQYPSLSGDLGGSSAGESVLRIGLNEGDFLYELSTKADIPIKSNHQGVDMTFSSALHFLLFELAENKELLLSVEAGYPDLQALVDKGLIVLLADWDRKRIGVLRSVLLQQCTQHPMMRKLLLRLEDRKMVPQLVLGSNNVDSVEDIFVGDEVGRIWIEIADKIRMEFQGNN